MNNFNTNSFNILETATTTKLIKFSPASVCVLDRNLKLVSHSDQWLETFGIDSEETVGCSYFEFFPDLPEELKELLAHCLEGKGLVNAGHKMLDKEGRVKWFRWKINPWRHDNEEVGGLIIVAEDITEIKKREEILLKAKRVARIGGWEVDLIANTVHWTEITKEIHEVPQDYVPCLEAGINFYKEGEDREKITHLVSEGISDGKPWETELRIITAKGREVWVRAKGEAEIVNGKCVRLFGTFQDIDSKKRAELKYQQASDRLAVATKAAHVGIWDYNVAENSLVWDDNMYSLYGIKKEDFSGVYEAWETAVHPDDQEEGKRRIQMAISGEKEFDTEFRVVWPNGEVRFIRAFAITQRGKDGKALNMIGTNWDITEIRKAENKLKNLLDISSEQNKSLMNFAHIVSHNLRSHSSNLSMLMGFLSKEQDENEKERLISMLDEAAESLNETVQHLNEVVQVKTAANEKMKPVNLLKAIGAVEKNLSVLIEEQEAEFIKDIPDEIKVKAIPAYLESIFLNLFTNSLKYSSEERCLQVKIEAEADDSHIWVNFSDNGLGIDMERHGGKIFGMYKTFHRHKDSKGIGLFITKNQVESMNGKITVESEVNAGTTFRIRLERAN